MSAPATPGARTARTRTMRPQVLCGLSILLIAKLYLTLIQQRTQYAPDLFESDHQEPGRVLVSRSLPGKPRPDLALPCTGSPPTGRVAVMNGPRLVWPGNLGLRSGGARLGASTAEPPISSRFIRRLAGGAVRARDAAAPTPRVAPSEPRLRPELGDDGPPVAVDRLRRPGDPAMTRIRP
mgnify:CR=1 FL=1